MEENIVDLIKSQVDVRPLAPALLGSEGTVLNYRETYDRILSIADTLARCGIKFTDRVILAADNGPWHVVAMLGVAHAAAAVLLDPWAKKREIRRIFEVARPTLVIADSFVRKDLFDEAKERDIEAVELRDDGVIAIDHLVETRSAGIPMERTELSSGEEIALLSATSGSTSVPKFIPITHRMERARLMNLVSALSLTEYDAYLNLMPQFHSTGKGLIMATLISGGHAICPPREDLHRFHTIIEEYQPTWTSLSSTMCRMVLKLPKIRTGLKLRFIRISNEFVTTDLVERVRSEFRVPVVVSYGTSETGLISCTPLSNDIWGSGAVGVPVNCEVSILDETGVDLPTGRVGQIAVKGPNVMSGYFDNGINEGLKDGAFDTGDLGFIDENGWLYVTSRIKEVINRGGEKIAPAEIEECLLQHSAVKDVCCFPMVSETHGEEPGVAVVVKDQYKLSIAEVKQHVRQHLIHTKVPLAVFMLDKIPRTSAGKIQRRRVSEICSSILNTDLKEM